MRLVTGCEMMNKYGSRAVKLKTRMLYGREVIMRMV